ncbi:hypothetical protein J2T12_001040 [Paenibacillus anaericanus]|uniref:SMI1/KNR4 family protein n=1 Tax=Paenibacillus anaericanus TaxID=170367 RepID=UPI0027881964|nr:SMI1/KNR4 family protein [Paenibacillus anaericanus]MDQ0087634.1 hypothetical protein [Paenibacillus anaericanus]
MNPNTVIERLRAHRVRIEEPLTPEEISKIENKYKILFPPDLREFYLCGLPQGHNFINWRDTSKVNIDSIKKRLEWPLEGIIFDVEHNSFWYSHWGERPSDLGEAIRICIDKYRDVPVLIPIYSHRYIPSRPCETNNPIFSVYQTDIIYYGENLEEYFKVEFNDKEHKDIDFDSIKHIDFWTDLV